MAENTPLGLFERLASSAQSAATRLRVKSALNPMLWADAILGIPCFILAFLAYWAGFPALGEMFMYLGGAMLAATIVGFFFLMIFDRPRLQSEDYQLRHETIEVIKQKGSPFEVSPAALAAIVNPVAPALPRGRQ